STYSPTLYQFQGTEQSYWNIGVNLAIPVEDILDLKAAVRRKRLEVDRAQLEKDAAFDKLKLQIVSLYVKITNNLVSLKTASEHAAIYQGAGALNQEQFQNGEMSIEAFARTKEFENTAVSNYQTLQTMITSDILTLEILTHTPIITNTLTDVTLDEKVVKSQKELDKEHKEFQKQLKKELDEDKKKLNELEKADKKAEKAEKKAAEEAEKAAKKESKEKASK
ncbi:MAG: TolC family protein, partial [Prevotellaceae bacterium]|nr:TolC family protein [Prevotellaceae bacterium]